MLNARLRAKHCPSILEFTALVALAGSAMRGLDLGAGADTGLEPEFHGSVQRKGLEHRTRNSVTAVSAGDGLFWAVLFSLNILARPSISFRSLSCAATGLGSKMVARCSVFVR